MSQAISLVLSCCMLFNTVVVPMLNVKNTVSNPVNQLDNTSSSPKVTMMNNLENTPNDDTNDNQVTTNVVDEFIPKGNLEIDLKFALPIQNTENPNMGIIVKDEQGNEQNINFNGITTMSTLSYTLGEQKGELSIKKMDQEGIVLNGQNLDQVKYYSITIYQLQQGTYSIELYGNGYKSYTVSNIELKDYAKRVSISNEKGLFEIGDVNQDGKVDEDDIDLIIENIDNTDKEKVGAFDLSRDGKIDISDIAIIASSINGEAKNLQIVDTSAMMNYENITVTGNIDGSVSDLLQKNDSVSVKPSDETKDISKENPAVMSFDLEQPITMSQFRLGTKSENVPETIILEITDEFGNVTTYEKELTILENIHFFTDSANDNTIVIDLDGQIAVKKVTIKIVKTSSKKLAEIAEVEFLNNVYEKVPVPEIEVPKNISVITSSEKAEINFDQLRNVIGYEILVQELKDGQIVSNIIYQTTYTNYVIKELKNYKNYQVSVRAVNGEWKSNYSNSVSFSPEPNRLPPRVDMVNLTPVSSGFNISYKDMKDTLSYNIYYRKSGDLEFKKIENIKGSSYQLRDLVEGTTYEVYVSGNNHLGEGEKSVLATATTKEQTLPDMVNYALLNTSNGTGVPSNHITSIQYKVNSNQASEFALVDNDFNSYYQANTWDLGGYNAFNNGPIFNFDDEYTIDHIFIVPKDDQAAFFYSKINYLENGISKKISTSIKALTSPNGQRYYRLDFNKITTNQIQINLANYSASGNIAIREVRFYQYDSLVDDVANLFLDDLRVELKEGVTMDDINALEERVNTIDPVSKEYHPNKTALLNELDYAKKILNDTAIQDAIIVDQNISTTKNTHLGFSPLSDLQPLGVAVRAKDQITIYVGTKGNTLPQLVFTQYYAEASTWKQVVVNLKKGQNIIDVPQIGTMATERGGSIYIRYPKATADKEIKVRVSGGVKIPVLDIHQLSDEIEIKNAISTYIEQLKTYVENLPSMYQEEGMTFDRKLSVLNSTEIVTKNGLFSVAATAAYDGIRAGASGSEEMNERLYRSLVAFEEMMNLFYRHKGLSENASDPKDKTPSSRINIRLMRMFDGAFMYASGDHIGIEYGSIAGLMQGRPNEVIDGTLRTTGYFGWGISHEIGHQINQANLSYAEVTNNVYSLLAQTNDDIAKARIEDRYHKIYQKVTSNTFGKGSDVFVNLGMYWQLHLAYDNNKTVDDVDSIYAKINRLSRRNTLTGYTKDELLIILASQAAGYDLTEFFQKWGLTPSDKAIEYIASLNLEKESRPIWYLNDDARRYRLNQGSAMDNTTMVSANLILADNQNKRYTLTFDVDKSKDTILGYEIKRNGVVIMFTTENEFTDIIGSMNNQAITYEVTAYDKYLNKTNTATLDEVKVSHDGSVKKDHFSITSNFKENDEIVDVEDPDMDTAKLKINQLIDNQLDTIFNGTTRINLKDKTNPYVIIDLNSKLDVSGIKYQAASENGKLLDNAIQKYNIYVSKNREDWILAKTGTFKLNKDNQFSNIVYFDKEGTTGKDQLWTYSDISYIKIEAIGNSGISGSEFDVIAPPGDNVELSKDTIGILENDYHYLDSNGNDAVIKKGSIVFKGEYRGHPAFNAMLLVDANYQSDDENIEDSVFSGENFLFAKLNSNHEVNEIASGYWFYVVTVEQYQKMQGKTIRAELYRVDDALTNEGQRLTSTSLAIHNLPSIEELPLMQIIDTTKGEAR